MESAWRHQLGCDLEHGTKEPIRSIFLDPKQDEDVWLIGETLIAFSPDGNLLACPLSNSIVIHDISTGKLHKRLRQDGNQRYRGVIWTKQLLASLGASIGIWDFDSGEVQRGIGFPGNYWAPEWFTISPDGSRFATADVAGTVRVWSRSDGAELWTMNGTGTPKFGAGNVRIDWSRDSTQLISGLSDYPATGIVLWSLATSNQPEFVPLGEAYSLNLSPSNQRVGVGGDGSIAVYDFQAKTKITPGNVEIAGIVTAFSWSPDGQSVAFRSSSTVLTIWELKTQQLRKIDTPIDPLQLAWSPEQSLIAVADVNKVGILNPQTGDVVHLLKGSTAVAWSPDGERFVCGRGFNDKNAGLLLYDAKTGKLFGEIDGRPSVRPLWASPFVKLHWLTDANKVVSTSRDQTIRFWDMNQRVCLDTIPIKSPGAGFASVNRDARMYAVPGINCIHLRSLPSTEPLGCLVWLDGERWMRISPEGHYVAGNVIEKDLVFVIETDEGQVTLTPNEFRQKYG